MLPNPRLVLLLLSATVALTAGCSSHKDANASASSALPASSSVTATESASMSARATTSTPRSSAVSSAPVPARTTSSSAPVSPGPSGPIDGPGGCLTASLSVAALRASGAAGHQYAFLQFTNNSAKTCSLTGYPGVALIKAGAVLGSPATRSGKPVTKVQLAPGHSATAQLVDASTCNAQNSDSVQIYPPNRTDKVVVPLSLRGCALSIDPITAG